MALDAIAASRGVTGWKAKFKSACATLDGRLLLKPQTYMNLSGEAAGEALRFHKLTAEQVVIFHDDLDLPPFEIRVKQGGGTGGHNGLKSLDAHIGPDYWRVRLGIGHPAPGLKGEIVTNYVLGNFAKAEQSAVQSLCDALASEFDLALAGKISEYQAAVSKRLAASILFKG